MGRIANIIFSHYSINRIYCDIIIIIYAGTYFIAVNYNIIIFYYVSLTVGLERLP